jgi:hypothetical protein
MSDRTLFRLATLVVAVVACSMFCARGDDGVSVAQVGKSKPKAPPPPPALTYSWKVSDYGGATLYEGTAVIGVWTGKTFYALDTYDHSWYEMDVPKKALPVPSHLKPTPLKQHKPDKPPVTPPSDEKWLWVGQPTYYTPTLFRNGEIVGYWSERNGGEYLDYYGKPSKLPDGAPPYDAPTPPVGPQVVAAPEVAYATATFAPRRRPLRTVAEGAVSLGQLVVSRITHPFNGRFRGRLRGRCG